MLEEPPVTFAEIRLCVPVGIECILILHASAPAKGKVAAEQTLVAEFLLGTGKITFFARGGKLFDRCVEDVSKPPFRLNEKVTGEAITVVLNDDVLAALPAEGANRVVAGQAIGQHRVEVTNADFGGSGFIPAVEQSAEKGSI